MNMCERNILESPSAFCTLQLCHELDKNTLREKLKVSVPTVNKFIDKFRDDGLIISRDNKYRVNPEIFTLIGISIGSAQSKIVLLDAGFHIMGGTKALAFKSLLISKLKEVLANEDVFLRRSQEDDISYAYFSTPDSLVEIKMCLDKIFESVRAAVENPDQYGLNIVSIGISTTGIVNRDRQEIMEAHNIPSIEHKTIESLLFEEYRIFLKEKGINIHLEQNSKAAVIAEKISLYMHESKHKDCRNIASLYLGAGLGCGLILDGRVFYGKSGYAGEVGHLIAPDILTAKEKEKLEEANPVLQKKCSCGRNNCYDHLIRKYGFGKDKSSFSAMTTADIAAFLKNEDNAPRRKALVKYIGSICEMLCNVLNIEMIIFTGKFAKSREVLSRELEIESDKNVLHGNAEDCVFEFSELGVSAPAIGAAVAAYYDRIGQDLRWDV